MCIGWHPLIPKLCNGCRAKRGDIYRFSCFIFLLAWSHCPDQSTVPQRTVSCNLMVNEIVGKRGKFWRCRVFQYRCCRMAVLFEFSRHARSYGFFYVILARWMLEDDVYCCLPILLRYVLYQTLRTVVFGEFFPIAWWKMQINIYFKRCWFLTKARINFHDQVGQLSRDSFAILLCISEQKWLFCSLILSRFFRYI